jgi:hypothetical protein
MNEVLKRKLDESMEKINDLVKSTKVVFLQNFGDIVTSLVQNVNFLVDEVNRLEDEISELKKKSDH